MHQYNENLIGRSSEYLGLLMQYLESFLLKEPAHADIFSSNSLCSMSVSFKNTILPTIGVWFSSDSFPTAF